MIEIFQAIKKSAIEINNLIKKGNVSSSINQNFSGDTQMELDLASDDTIKNIFQAVPSIKAIASEEQKDIVLLNENGNYLVAYDPLDGSSLIDVNLSVGSIFGIYKNDFTGSNIVASAYVVYGPKLELVIAVNSVKMYRFIDNEFKFVQNITLNSKGNLIAPGAKQSCWTPHHKKMIDDIFKDGYQLRYSGGMVPDLHQILLKGGGLFSYPSTTNKLKGKLRQLFEIFPFSYIYEKANGQGVDGFQRLLDIKTFHIHDTSPCFFGSNNEINRVLKVYKENEER